MINYLNYLYNINIVKKIEYKNKIIYLTDNNENYLLEKLEKNNKSIFLIKSFYELNIPYVPKKNIYNDFFSIVDNVSCVLIRLDSKFMDEIDIVEMIEFYKKSEVYLNGKIKYRLNWINLWTDKIMYLKNHLNNNLQLNKSKIYLFNYYMGFAINSIIYLRDNYINNYAVQNITFQHRRINTPCYKLDFYNIVNIYIDVVERDVSEYIKSLFINKCDYISELDFYLKTNHIDHNKAVLLYSRIIYPSQFFDYYEQNINTEYINIFYDTKLYETFIKKTYEIINSYVNISKFEIL